MGDVPPSQKGKYYFGAGQVVAYLEGAQSCPHAFANNILGPSPLATFVFSIYFNFNGNSWLHL